MGRRVQTRPTPSREPRVAPLRSSTSLADELTAVVAAWEAGGAHSPQTLARMSQTVARFARRLTAAGITSFSEVHPRQAQGFVTAPVASGQASQVATQHARRTAVRTLYRTLRALGHAVADPTLDTMLPPRGVLAARPLTEDEVTLCRATAQLTGGHRAPVRATAWALGEATAVSSEITTLTVAALDDPAAPQAVQLPGTRRHDARVGLLTDWGSRVLAARVTALHASGGDEATLLAYGGQAPLLKETPRMSSRVHGAAASAKDLHRS
jgi:hypothetical protein